MKMHDYAYCRNLDEKIEKLSELCPENWNMGPYTDNTILRNYIAHTFMKISEEGKILETPNHSLINTGLFTGYYEPIYAMFVANRNEGRQKWFLEGFRTRYQLSLAGITKLPERADYFTNPEDMVYDMHCEIVPQYDHIFGNTENLARLPEKLRNDKNRVMIFDSALIKTKHMLEENYRIAVPQYFNGKAQLMVPLYLTGGDIADIALTLCKNETNTAYIGHTCLTLYMAYNNARLIAKPDVAWLTAHRTPAKMPSV